MTRGQLAALPLSLRLIGTGVVLFALAWLGGLAWNVASNYHDLGEELTELAVMGRSGEADCEPTGWLWPFGRHWDYRCDVWVGTTRTPAGVQLVRVDDTDITARQLSNGRIIKR